MTGTFLRSARVLFRLIARRLPELILIAMVSVVVALGVQATGSHTWPGDSDISRDLAQAQTIADGDLLGDPAYLHETLWYNPLIPALIATLSKVTDLPLPLVYTRAGAYLNLLAPIAFYLLVTMLFGRWPAVAATFAFLFIQISPINESSLAYATYSAWLYAANFAQVWFYLTLAAYIKAVQVDRWRWYVATGGLLGIAFLSHTAPAVMAGGVIGLHQVYRWARSVKRRSQATRGFRPIARLGIILLVAAVVSAPLIYSLVLHYHLQIVNLAPGNTIHSPLALSNLGDFVVSNFLTQPYMIFVALGLIGLIAQRLKVVQVKIFWLWLSVDGLYLVYTYLRQWLKLNNILLPGILPNYHFLFYLRAIEATMFGCGLVAIGDGLSKRVSRWRAISAWQNPIARGLLIGSLIGLFVIVYPAYLEREDFNSLPAGSIAFEQNADLIAAYTWLRANTQPTDVLLTSDRLATYVVGPAGRKIVAGDVLYSNPYVDWKTRATDRDAMFGYLMSGDADRFLPLSSQYHLTYVLAGGKLAEGVNASEGGLVHKVFSSGSLSIFRVMKP